MYEYGNCLVEIGIINLLDLFFKELFKLFM